MVVSFADSDLERLWVEAGFTMGLPPFVVTSYRKKLQAISQARDTRDLRNMKSLRLEKLKGKRQHEHSMRLNGQYRLVLEIASANGEQRIVLKSVEDYH